MLKANETAEKERIKLAYRLSNVFAGSITRPEPEITKIFFKSIPALNKSRNKVKELKELYTEFNEVYMKDYKSAKNIDYSGYAIRIGDIAWFELQDMAMPELKRIESRVFTISIRKDLKKTARNGQHAKVI